MQAVIFTCANLDSAYFVLLDHSLTCGWAAPPVPPPHDYFPAVAALHPGCCQDDHAAVVPWCCNHRFFF